MIEQCRFMQGEKGIQCNMIKGLNALKQEFGDMFSVKELKSIVCESNNNDDCPAFRRIKELGARSEFAK